MQALSTGLGIIESIYNVIQSPLSLLCKKTYFTRKVAIPHKIKIAIMTKNMTQILLF